MDCERFEATMIDELYGELDELTLAASKRHVGGCARCSALIGGLRATRKLVTLPVVAPSEGFESRLLSAVDAAEAAKVAPPLRLAVIVSRAGQWAMRPQTAMAAVLLLAVGTSSLFLTRRAPRSALEAASASFTVTENGAPAAPAAAPTMVAGGEGLTIDSKAAAAAHGAALAASAAPAAAALARAAEATRDLGASAEGFDSESSGIKRAYAPKAVARSSPPAPQTPFAGGGGGPSGAVNQALENAPAEAAETAKSAPADRQFSPPPPPPAKDEALAGAKQQYRDGDYAGAVRSFDGIASGGDTGAGLWAARSVRDGAGGCALAAPRFDQVAGASWGANDGFDATLEGAQCYARLGQAEAARARYSRLLTVPAYASRAQAGINAMSQVAMKARPSMQKPMAIAPAAAPASPAAAAAGAPAARPSQTQSATPQK
jgi:hypothetical protein